MEETRNNFGDDENYGKKIIILMHANLRIVSKGQFPTQPLEIPMKLAEKDRKLSEMSLILICS